MKGKTVVITGGTSGIGEIAADRLAQRGARIVLIARSKSRGKVTLARLHEKAPDLAHTVHYADLTRISEMKRVAVEIASQEPRIDVLINNAGAMFASRRLTDDGLECTFALNHMAYFVITEGLRRLRRHALRRPKRLKFDALANHSRARTSPCYTLRKGDEDNGIRMGQADFAGRREDYSRQSCECEFD